MPRDGTQTQHDATGERLRRLGLRVTPQRLLVMEALMAHGGHMTADDVMRWTAERYPAINLATIYRTLDLLATVGLVTQTDLGGGAVRYELAGETAHHHLVCERCGGVTELDDAVVAPVWERLLREYGFRASSRHLALFGVCRACRAAEHSQAPVAQRPEA